ncbi:Aldehyde dehydrogenase family 2 member B4, mitochondrial [Glycine soja]
MATRRLSWLLSRSLSSSPSFQDASLLHSLDNQPILFPFFIGRNSGKWGNVNRFSTAAAVEELITPQVPITYTKHLINGQFVDAASGKTFPTYDPRTGEVIARVAEGDAEDINRAVSAARKAFEEGPSPKMTAYKNSDELAALETWNNGKPYEQWATSELPTFVRLFRYYAVPADGNYHVETLHEPIGVAGQIIPWNFPLLMFAWKVGPALACGNTVILKTAEQTPLTALYVAKDNFSWQSLFILPLGVFTKNVHTANTLMRALRVGTVWINCFDVFDAAIPFGGYKMSGIGREKGIYSLNNYLQVKAVVSPVKNPAWL